MKGAAVTTTTAPRPPRQSRTKSVRNGLTSHPLPEPMRSTTTPPTLNPQLPLSRRQFRLLVSAASYWREHGFSPSLRDLMAHSGISSTSVVAHNLRALQRIGLLTQMRGVSRSIALTDNGWEASGLTRPCCGGHP